MQIEQHVLQGICFLPSPHFNERPDEQDISLIVLHNISLPAGQFGLPYISDLFLGSPIIPYYLTNSVYHLLFMKVDVFCKSMKYKDYYNSIEILGTYYSKYSS